MMFRLIVLALIAAGCGELRAEPDPTNVPAKNYVLIIDPSTMPVTAGKVTLTIGTMGRTNGVYQGDYKVNVSPYFFNNDKGKLAIVVPDDAIAKIERGKVTAVVGTATSGKDGTVRHVDAVAVPMNRTSGMIRITFMVKERKMYFEPNYHVVE